MKDIEIKLFGAFRKYVPSGMISVSLVEPILVSSLKQHVVKALLEIDPKFQETTLIFESALATESRILNDGELTSGETSLALLPPVCGG